MNKKIVLSLSVIGLVAAIAIGGTIAFFSDTETSKGNTFTAGELDLKIDNTCHYNGMVCECVEDSPVVCKWQDDPNDSNDPVPTKDAYIDGDCTCTWDAKDLAGERFYDYEDIKPGDWGEHTLSIHVIDNDAYGRILTTAIENREHGCTEPEGDVDGTCTGRWCGELAQNMYTFSWLDEGTVIGWQCGEDAPCTEDLKEGDNIWQCNEQILTDEECVDGVTGPNTRTYCPVLSKAEAASVCAWSMTGGNEQEPLPQQYVQESDLGLIEGCKTYYIGTAWFVPNSVGNIIQGDSIKADISFEVIQARHNDLANPWGVQ